MTRIEKAQQCLWNGTGGQNWVIAQELLDRMYRPFEPILADAVSPGARVLDVGCGSGATTVAAARRTGEPENCVGVDISEPMIAAARERAEQQGLAVQFLRADAAAYAFQPASFDAIISRFGVMFFDDPTAAFANLRAAARDGGTLRCIVWRGPEDNPFMTTAERAVAHLLPELPPRIPDAPGQFGFADPAHVRAVLGDSGWTGIDIAPLDMPCAMPASQLPRYLSLLGPVGRALSVADETTRARVLETLVPAFRGYVHGGEVRYTAACWLINARAAGSGAA
ncbi:class I SAM-dependent methyltransferase [Nocardia sp. IFM 10818]